MFPVIPSVMAFVMVMRSRPCMACHSILAAKAPVPPKTEPSIAVIHRHRSKKEYTVATISSSRLNYSYFNANTMQALRLVAEAHAMSKKYRLCVKVHPLLFKAAFFYFLNKSRPFNAQNLSRLIFYTIGHT